MNITLDIDGTEERYPRGVTVGKVVSNLGVRSTFPPLGAIVDGRLEYHDVPLERDCAFKPVKYSNFHGFSVYRRSAVIILLEAALRVYPESRLVIGQSLSEGYFFSLASGQTIGSLAIFNIEQEMKRLVEADLPATRLRVSPGAACAYYEHLGFPDKVDLLRHLTLPDVDLVGYGDLLELGFGPITPSTGLIPRFALAQYGEGFVLRFPTLSDLERFPTWSVKKGRLKIARSNVKLFYVCRETRRANRLLGIETVGDLNRLIADGRAEEVIAFAERFFHRRMLRVARYVKRTEGLRVFFVSGLAASGVSVFSRQLSAALERAGVPNLLVREADYGHPGHLALLDPAGKAAASGNGFNRALAELFEGGEVPPPPEAGREGEGKPLRIPDGGILLAQVNEGLDRKMYPVLHRSASRSIFITCLPQIRLDNHNRVFSSNFRCLRWVVKGELLGCRAPVETVRAWPAVRKYENRNMLPFQNSADVVFNSALVYEAAVLQPLVEPLLERAWEERSARPDIDRLREFIRCFIPLDHRLVPADSALRDYLPGRGGPGPASAENQAG